MHFFDTYLGGYVVQSVIHSIVTLVVVESSLRIWDVGDAKERFRYRLLVLVLPAIMYHLFQAVAPHRGSFYFIEDTAVFSSIGWLGLRLFSGFPMFLFGFFIVTSSVTLIMILQEIVPILKDLSTVRHRPDGLPAGTVLDSMVAGLTSHVRIERPSVVVVDHDRPLLFTIGTRRHDIVISSFLLNTLNERQMKSALAHEIAHIIRRTNAVTLVVFLVRICMFFNPVSLLEFRKLIHDDEQICDDMTVALTRDPAALASVLRLFSPEVPSSRKKTLTGLKERIELSSHNLLLSERIERLEKMDDTGYDSSGWFGYILTAASIVVLNYFIV